MLHRVRAGVFVRATDVAGLTREQRVLVRARAWQAVAKSRPLFSHVTAAPAHALPLWDADDGELHVIVSDDRPGAAEGLVRHRGRIHDEEVVEIGGMLFTSLERTVADVARTAARTTAVCIADAALRRAAYRGPRRYDLDRAGAFRHTVREIAARSPHGARRAMGVLEFADGRSQLPGESVSRVHLVALGFAAPSLQVRVPASDGGDYWVDFGLDDVLALGEFDGKGKYRDELLRAGLTLAQVLEREKQREDWIRGVTQRRFARWGSEHIGTASALGNRLAAFGIVAPRVPSPR